MIFKLWDWETVIDVFPLIFEAMWLVLGLTIGCYAFALLFGAVWTFIRRVVTFKPLNWLIILVMNFIRTTPPLVQLFFLFFAWPQIPYVGVTLDPIPAAIVGLGLHFSTYVSEIYRSGIESVPKGQWEAATALNYSKRQKWTRIVLPQAIPPTVPMLGNYLIIMFKEIPLTSAIGVSGMLVVAYDYGAQYFEFIEPLTLVAFFFLVLSYPSALFVNWLEKKMNRRFEKPKKGSDDNRKEVTAS
jgi:polar amino acid transport system permease protein